jgi:hypothetical protein
LKQTSEFLTLEESTYLPPTIEKEASPYHDKVLEGASLVPRTFWFVEFIPGSFGLNPETPLVKSLVLPDAKDPWKKVILRGEIEREFIFLTVTGKFVLPFKPQFMPIVLPIKRDDHRLAILSSKDLRKDGKLKTANWLDEAESRWKDNATKTSLKNFPKPMDRVNYHNGLILQKRNIRYYVIYTGSGTNLAAAVVDTQNVPDVQIGNARIPARGFVADYKTYWFGTNNLEEAFYLTAILNSNTMDQMIKPYQSRGKFGPRDICRLPFELNLPKYNSENRLHRRIVALGVKARKEATSLPKMSRLKMKAAIPSMKEIDKLVSELLSQ